MALNRRRNRMIWDRMKQQKRDPEKGTLSSEELHRGIGKIRHIAQKQQGEQSGTSGGSQEIDNSSNTNENESTISTESFGVSAVMFKRYPGATGVRYIQTGEARCVQDDNN